MKTLLIIMGVFFLAFSPLFLLEASDEYCGDGVCDSWENHENCPEDCPPPGPVCGDGICEGNENCINCPEDCGPCPPVCGDGVCEYPENCENCPIDCGICPVETEDPDPDQPDPFEQEETVPPQTEQIREDAIPPLDYNIDMLIPCLGQAC